LHDGIKGHGVDGSPRTLGNDDEEGALELKVDEKGDIVGAFLTPSQLGKDQEASPALAALCNSHTLPDGSHGFKIAFGYTAGLYDTYGTVVSVQKEDVGDDDGYGEDPFGNLERDRGLDLARPFLECEQIDGSKGVGDVDGAGNNDEDPEPNVGKGCEAGRGLEVGKVLSKSAYQDVIVVIVGRGRTM
jgi:hypothetical protein